MHLKTAIIAVGVLHLFFIVLSTGIISRLFESDFLGVSFFVTGLLIQVINFVVLIVMFYGLRTGQNELIVPFVVELVLYLIFLGSMLTYFITTILISLVKEEKFVTDTKTIIQVVLLGLASALYSWMLFVSTAFYKYARNILQLSFCDAMTRFDSRGYGRSC
ncbi:unnamed protein product [Soboliphyme baturini]|uniref:MARVEL domain-containing protein n=1 Tax=Soboliphyme baturini TaxID=241478 RepID=A0A183J088_9BILA|nr:unnamed protein product [Soboliphyme baturini]